MNESPWLILDCNYLCYKSFFSMGFLSHGDKGTGTLFGFLRELLSLRKKFNPRGILFCFDVGKPFRKERYPEYKANRRKDMSEEDRIAFNEMKKQIRALRLSILERLGFKNIWWTRGYEADDFMATAAQLFTKQSEKAIVVTSDQDLFSILSDSVSFYDPRKEIEITANDFSSLYKLLPIQWEKVKAIAGCSSDNIKGIVGVGEKTAIKYLHGELKEGSKALKSIEEGWKIINENMSLVHIPYMGCPCFIPEEDEWNWEAWKEVALEYGMKSMVKELPIGRKRYGKGQSQGFGI